MNWKEFLKSQSLTNILTFVGIIVAIIAIIVGLIIATFFTVSNEIKSMPNVNTTSAIILEDPTLQCVDQLKLIGRNQINLDLDIDFIDVYHNQTNDLIYEIQNYKGKPFYLIEGASKERKSTFGKNL